MGRKNYVGQSVVRIDAWDKVTGSETYCADLAFPHQLYGSVYRSPFPHARIVGMDLTGVRQLPGVKAVVTGEDFPNLYGLYVADQPFLAFRKVRFVGEPVVAVAAETAEIAEEAIRRVQVEFEPLPAVFDVFAAVADGAPLLHEDWSRYKTAGFVHPIPASNICDHFQLRKGDVASGWQEADVVVENEYSTAMIQHVPIETHCAIAQYRRDGSLTLWAPCQSPFATLDQLAEALNLPRNKVRIIATTIGGAFGGKSELRAEPLAIALAMKVPGRHVKIVFSREEEFVSSVVRGAAHVKVKMGAKRDGTLVAMEVTTHLDTGAYATTGPRVNYIGGFASSGPYQVPNIKIDGYCVCTNKPLGTSHRGFGVPEVAFAYDSQMDILAKELNMDPLALRMKNALEEGSISATGEYLASVGVKDCLKAVGEKIGWESPGPVMTPAGKIRAKGVGTFIKLTGTPSNSSVIIRLNEDGTVNVMRSGMEMGQGTTTVIAQIVAQELGIDIDKVEMAPVDTEFSPFEKHSAASRLTFHVGNAAILAVKDMLEQLKWLAAKQWKVAIEEVRVEAGEILGPSGQVIVIDQIGQASILRDKPPVIGRGSYSTSDIYDPPDQETGQSKRPTAFWMYGAQAAEVEVDPETGQVEVLKIAAAHDVGRAINPLGCRQQVEGACVMGMGSALLEEMILDHGKVMNANLVDYKVPTVADATLEIDVTLVENRHPEGPFGAKGIGEPGTCPTAAAIGNAVSRAIGQRVYRLPVKPETIVAALRKTNP